MIIQLDIHIFQPERLVEQTFCVQLIEAFSKKKIYPTKICTVNYKVGIYLQVTKKKSVIDMINEVQHLLLSFMLLEIC